MAAFTTTQAGDWSDTATWGGSGPPGNGDTATVSHAVTVDVDTIVGTSPNDTTTLALSVTGSTQLTVAAGVSLTLRGNFDFVNMAMVMGAGSSLIFDASLSGGTPVYLMRALDTASTWSLIGTTGSHAAVSAVSGQSATLQFYALSVTCSFVDFTRVAPYFYMYGTNCPLSITDCTFTSCGYVQVWPKEDGIFRRNMILTPSVTLCFQYLPTVAAGANFQCIENCFFNGKITVSGATTTRIVDNFHYNCVETNPGYTTRRCYAFMDTTSAAGGVGNPHFLQTDLVGGTPTYDQWVFEYYNAYAVDTGDCHMPFPEVDVETNLIRGNIVLPCAYAGNADAAGTLVTHWAETDMRITKLEHNTAHVGSDGRGAIAIGELNVPNAGELSVTKSNVFWSDTSGTRYKLIQYYDGAGGITAAGFDYNWDWNIAAGNNGRGLQDDTGNDLWDGTTATGTDAADNGVDDNAGTGDPVFFDSSRNLLKWSETRGHGATVALAIAAIQADLQTRITDLIDYVFAGFRPTNSAMRTAGHDGGCAGASNFHLSTRKHSRLNGVAASMTAFYSL